VRARGPAVVLAGLVLTAACAAEPDDVPGTGVDASRLEPACPAPPSTPPRVSAGLVNSVVSAADLPAWQAGDIGASAQLRDHRLVWVFGDTLRDPSTSPQLVANSMLVSSGTCVSQLLPGDEGPVVPDVGIDQVRWPMSVVRLQPRAEYATEGVTDVLVVLCARIQRGSGGAFDFTFRGTTAAVFAVAEDGVPTLIELIEVTPDDGAADQVNWGAAATVHGPWYYVYGTRLPDESSFGRELYAARVPVANPEDRGRWEFWDGSRWQSDIDGAAAVLPAQGGVSQTLSVDYTDGQYVAVSKRDGDLGDFVYLWTSPSPVGPWTPRQGLKAPAGFDTGALKYAPLAHPEVTLSSGRLLVSISRNTTDFAQLLADPAVGRPIFAEVDRP
jgi:Domain of unknown function (DUF4185)